MIFAMFVDRRKNYVFLRYRRDAGQERARVRRERFSKFGWLLLAATAGAALKPVAEWIFVKLAL